MIYMAISAHVSLIELVILYADVVQPAALTLQPPTESQAHSESPTHTASTCNSVVTFITYPMD